jgi:peptide/nickel transport system permease protein
MAGPIAPYHYETAATRMGFHPPMLTRIRVFDADGSISWPFVYGIRVVDPELKIYDEDTSAKHRIRLFVRGDDYGLLGVIRWNVHLFGVDAPGRLFLFGSDSFGRDVFSRLLYGAQVSLSIGVVGVLISTAIGMLVGGVAGYVGGLIDFIVMRTVELLLALPSLYFVLILRQMFETGASSVQIYFIMVMILSFIRSASDARVIRGMVLSIRERDYVVAARALGFGNTRIILKHVLPNTLSFVIVTATISVPFFILNEVALSYLGVGIREPEASWGNMLSSAQNIRNFVDFPWTLVPGIFIFAAVMAWNFLGDGLRDAADPRTLG